MGGIKNDFQIFKSLTTQADAQNLSEGNIILRCVFYYRTHIDRNEFTIINKKGHFSLTNKALIFCCHKKLPNNKSHLVRINSPCKLFLEINRKLSRALLSDGDFFGEVRYEEMNHENPRDFDIRQINFFNEVYKNLPTEDVVNNYDIECAYYKKEKYSDENEVRMCFLVCPERLANINNLDDITVKFYRRVLDNKTISWKTEEIDHSTWRNDEKDSQSELNYWFEVHLKVKESNFTLIKT